MLDALIVLNTFTSIMALYFAIEERIKTSTLIMGGCGLLWFCFVCCRLCFKHMATDKQQVLGLIVTTFLISTVVIVLCAAAYNTPKEITTVLQLELSGMQETPFEVRPFTNGYVIYNKLNEGYMTTDHYYYYNAGLAGCKNCVFESLVDVKVVLEPLINIYKMVGK